LARLADGWRRRPRRIASFELIAPFTDFDERADIMRNLFILLRPEVLNQQHSTSAAENVHCSKMGNQCPMQLKLCNTKSPFGHPYCNTTRYKSLFLGFCLVIVEQVEETQEVSILGAGNDTDVITQVLGLQEFLGQVLQNNPQTTLATHACMYARWR